MRHSRALLAAIAAVAFLASGCTPATPKPAPAPPPPCAAVGHTPVALPSKAPDFGFTEAENRMGVPKDKTLLTFDDGGSDAHVRALEAVLQGKRDKPENQAEPTGAAFFFTGNAGKTSKRGGLKPIVQELCEHGYMVGNHSWSHPLDPPLTTYSDKALDAQISGGVSSTCFRPPGGIINHRVREHAAKLGYRICGWTVDPRDWDFTPRYKTADELVKLVLSLAKKHPELFRGGVILFHMHSRPQHGDPMPTLAALPRIIDGLREMGFTLCAPAAHPTKGEIPQPLPC